MFNTFPRFVYFIRIFGSKPFHTKALNLNVLIKNVENYQPKKKKKSYNAYLNLSGTTQIEKYLSYYLTTCTYKLNIIFFYNNFQSYRVSSGEQITRELPQEEGF